MNNTASDENLKIDVQELVKLRKEFDEIALNSRKKLYEVIAGAICLVDTYERDRLAAFSEHKFKVTKKTDAALIAIKLIFPNEDREQQKQCSVYAAAVRHAIEHKISPEEFPKYAEAFSGGIEKMRTGASRKANPEGKAENSANLARAREFLSTNTQGIELDHAFFLKPLPSGNEIVVLMRPVANGNYQAVFATTEPKAVSVALDTLGAHRAEPASDGKSRLFADMMPEAPDELEEALREARDSKRKVA